MTLRSLRYAVAVVAVLAGCVAAQEITGDIRGVVKDPSGALVSGATVKVNNTDRGETIRTLTTGADGSYVAPYLPVGRYQVQVEAPGFKTFVGTDIVLNVNDHRIVDVALQVGNVSETIRVEESPVAVDLETSEAGPILTVATCSPAVTFTIFPSTRGSMASLAMRSGAGN